MIYPDSKIKNTPQAIIKTCGAGFSFYSSELCDPQADALGIRHLVSVQMVQKSEIPFWNQYLIIRCLPLRKWT